MNTEPQCAKRESPIDDAFAETDKLLGILSEKISMLRGRLQPVLIEQEGKSPKGTGTAAPTRCAVHRTVEDINYRIGDRIEELDRLREELQI